MMSEHRTYEPRSAFMKWLERRLPIASLVHSSFVVYPTPRNLNYWWTFGGILTFMLGVQIVTGIVLAMHYVPHVDFAFDSVERIMRDVNYGWLLRYIHATGASFFFVAVYIHIARGMYYGSYKEPREVLWILGVILYLLMIVTGFVGYVLPWGQMSFWAATVITNLFSAIPVVGSCCTSARSRTRFRSGATSGRGGQLGLVARWPLTRPSMPGATWWNAASTGSNSGAGWRPATRSAP